MKCKVAQKCGWIWMSTTLVEPSTMKFAGVQGIIAGVSKKHEQG